VGGERFEIKPRELDRFIERAAASAGFDVSGGLEASGFVPTFRNVLRATLPAYGESTSHRRHMATQVAWIVYAFLVAIENGFEMPDGFAPKSIIVEAVDGPYMYEAVRISLWSEKAFFHVVSNEPIPLDRIKDPEGIPASYAPARRVLENLFQIVADEANALLPYARAIGSIGSADSCG
jgi:hypothetical protein